MKCSIISGLLCLVLSSSTFAATVWNSGALVVNRSNDKTNAWSPHEANGAVDDNGSFNVTINTVGADIWNSVDSGTYYYAGEVGDSEIIATIPYFKNNEGGCVNIGNYAKAGLMVRPTTFGYGPNVFFFRETSKASGESEISQLRFTTRTVENTSTADRKTSTDILDPNGDVRVRLVRRGNVFTAYYKLNVAESGWTQFYSYTAPNGVFADGALYGLIATAQNDSSAENIINVRFTDVVLRRLVEIENVADGISVSWSADVVAAPGETVTGFSLHRKELSIGGDYVPVISGLASTTQMFVDTTAVAGEAYKYKVVATIQAVDGTTYDFDIGESYLARMPLQTTNANPGAGGYTIEFVQNNQVTGTYYYKTSLYNPWNNAWNEDPSKNSVYPDRADDNLTSLNDFKVNVNLIFRPRVTGYYVPTTRNSDDGANIYMNGQLISEKTRYTSTGNVVGSPVFMEAGRNYDLKIKYFEGTGDESLFISFKRNGEGSWIDLGLINDPVPMPWTFQEKGYSPIWGNTIYTQENKSFTQFGSGYGFDGVVDEGQFASMKMDGGDFDFTTRLNLSTLASAGSAGIVLRADELSDSAEQVAVVYEAGKVNVYKRSAANTEATLIETVDVSPDFSFVRLAIARRGNMLSFYFGNGNAAANEREWMQIGVATEASAGLMGEAYVGLVTYSGNHTALSSAVFDRISAIPYAQVKTELVMTKGAGMESVLTIAETSPVVTRNMIEQNIVGYFWSNYIPSVIGTASINYLSSMDDEQGSVVAVDAPINTSITYNSGVTDPRALQFYQVTPMGSATGLPLAEALSSNTVKYGLALEEPSENGTGLFSAWYSSWQAGPSSKEPNLYDLTDLSKLSRSESTTYKLLSGKTMASRMFYEVFSGYLTAPYTGKYVFKVKTYDYVRLFINGEELIDDMENARTLREVVSKQIDLVAGERVPISGVIKVGDHDNGYAEILWKNGAGVNGDFAPIPLTSLSSDIKVEVTPAGENNIPTPGLASPYGDWREVQIGTRMDAVTYIHGTRSNVLTEPEKMNVAFLACSDGNKQFMSGKEDDGHFTYREVTGNFSLEANVTRPSGYINSARIGLVARKTLDAGSESSGIFRFKDQRMLFRSRVKKDGSYVNDSPIETFTGDKLHLKIERVHNTLNTYCNGELKSSVNVTSWGKQLYVGFAGSSQAAEHQSIGFFQNVEFIGSYNNATLIVVF